MESNDTAQHQAHVFILHGDDLLAIQKKIKEIAAGLGMVSASGGVEANRLNGRTAGWDALHTAADTLPFLTPHQLVIIDEPLGAYPQRRQEGQPAKGAQAAKEKGEETANKRQKEWQVKYIDLLAGAPLTTTLVLLLLDEFHPGGQNRGWELLRSHKWLTDWVEDAKELAQLTTFQLPNQRAMPSWIIGRCSQLEVKIQGKAAEELAIRTGNDTLLVEQELEKLITYKGAVAEITLEDVKAVSISGGLADVFKMIDAVVDGKKQEALRSLHILLNEQEAGSVYSLFVRHFRNMIQVSDLLDKGGKLPAIAPGLRLPDWQVEKIITQLRRFKMERLSAVYHRLLQMDIDSKRGGTPLEVALDELVLTV